MKDLEICKIKKTPSIAMIMMVIMSFSNLFGLNIAGLSVVIGVVIFFINGALEKRPTSDNGLDIKGIGDNLKDKKIWFWILLPLAMDIICLIISKLFLPEYIEYEMIRAGSFVAMELTILSIFQFLFFALGEEIAWRAFFQKELNKILTIIPTLLLSSLLFSLGHFKKGNPLVVAYGLFFVFINSLIYGIVFQKTKNAWISTISHFISNIFSIIIMILFL